MIIFWMISDDAKNKQFCSGVRQNPFFFLKLQFFRSAGNVIQQIKKSLTLGKAFFYLLDYITPAKNFQIDDRKKKKINWHGHFPS